MKSLAGWLLGVACVIGVGPAGAQETLEISRGVKKTAKAENLRVVLTGESGLVLRGRRPAIGGSVFHLDSPEAQVIFEGVEPSEVQENYLTQFRVHGEPAVHGENMRLVNYLNGTLVVPHGPEYEALFTYNQPGLEGDARGYVVHDYYRSAELGDAEDQIASFVLKRGYMATMAENENGTGASQVFIARNRDLEMSSLPEDLRDKVSFIRVFPWRYTAKKGYGGKLEPAELLDTTWFYDWGASSQSSIDVEYVPMRHNARWDSFEKINALENVTHLLGFNEPMQKDQANMTLEQVLNMWPRLQESGLRLGSICPTDGQKAVEWMYEFCDEAERLGYRVDYVVVHYYKANRTPKQLASWLREIHQRTGKPLWVKEFNSGAPWVKNHNPTPEEHAKEIRRYIETMDKLAFVERYAVFNLKQAGGMRSVLIEDTLTPSGRAYRDNDAPEAYRGR
ncbi:MAG: glycosyl hydrolase [Planctomycetota bacterium]